MKSYTKQQFQQQKNHKIHNLLTAHGFIFPCVIICAVPAAVAELTKYQLTIVIYCLVGKHGFHLFLSKINERKKSTK